MTTSIMPEDKTLTEQQFIDKVTITNSLSFIMGSNAQTIYPHELFCRVPAQIVLRG